MGIENNIKRKRLLRFRIMEAKYERIKVLLLRRRLFVLFFLKPLMTNGPHHIETSQLICSANQLTGFNAMGNIGR